MEKRLKRDLNVNTGIFDEKSLLGDLDLAKRLLAAYFSRFETSLITQTKAKTKQGQEWETKVV